MLYAVGMPDTAAANRGVLLSPDDPADIHPHRLVPDSRASIRVELPKPGKSTGIDIFQVSWIAVSIPGEAHLLGIGNNLERRVV